MKRTLIPLALAALILGLTGCSNGTQGDTGPSWVRTTVDSGQDVGWYTSLALDSDGHAHISYYDATNSALKYAANAGGAWTTEAVDSDGMVGWYASLAMDSSGGVFISYYDRSNEDLKLAVIE